MKRGIELLAVAATAILPCLSAMSSAASAQDQKPIRIAMARSVSVLPLWGITRFAEKQGLKVEMIASANNSEMQRQLQSGVEVASLGYQNPGIMAEQNVGNIKVIAGIYLGGQNLIMRKGVDLKSWKELEGKKIGMPGGSYSLVLFTLTAEEYGVDISKVNIVSTSAAGAPELQAVKTGVLDGLALWSPIIDRAVVEGYGYYPACCDIGSSKGYGPGNQILAANTDFLKDKEKAVKFLKAYAESIEHYSKNPDEAAATVAQYTGAPKEVIVEALKHGTWDIRLAIATAENVAKQGPRFGYTKTDMSAKVRSLVDLSYLAEALGRPADQLGEVKP